MSVFQIMIRKKPAGGTTYFGFPLFIVWLLLLPLGLVLLPFVLIACLAAQINPLRAFAAFWRIFAALRGTHVEIEDDFRTFVLHIA